MSALLDSLLDPARRAECRAADDAADVRAGTRYAPPYWAFAPLRPDQARNSHPLAGTTRRARKAPRPSRFGDLAS